MIRKGLIWLLGAALLLGAACRRVEEPSGTVTLTIHTGDPVTRAITPGDGVVSDGGGIFCTKSGDVVTPDLVIFIMNESGIVKRYPDTGTLLENDYDSGKATTLSISFEFNASEVGSYTVFALANLNGGDGNLSLPSLSGISSIADLEALQIGLGTGATHPLAGSRMPLSAKGTLNVSKGLYNKYNGLLELQMLRPFVKVQLSFTNLTGEVLSLTDCQVTFKDMNTSTAWLFSRDPDFVDASYGNYTTVAGDIATLTNIPATDDPVRPDVDERVRDAFTNPLLFFPSIAKQQTAPAVGIRYLCDISFKANGTQKTFTNLPIHDEFTRDIQSLSRNQYLHIETTISKGSNVSFNFIVDNWIPHAESVIFH